MVKMKVKVIGKDVEVTHESEYLIAMKGYIREVVFMPKGAEKSSYEIKPHEIIYVKFYGHDLMFDNRYVVGNVEGFYVDDLKQHYYLIRPKAIYLEEVDDELFDIETK